MTTISTNQLLAQMRDMAAAAARTDSSVGPAATPPRNDFSAALASAIDDVNHDMRTAGALKEAFVSGDRQTSLSEVMVAAQKARVEFQLVLQVRNKLLSAYHDVMNMQI